MSAATEADHQAALFTFLDYIAPRVPDVAYAFHVPNGEQRHKAAGARLKRMGVKRGVPDVWLPVRRGEHVGLVLELKRHGGRVAPAQAAWLRHLEAQGWHAAVAWDWGEAAVAVLKYLGEDPGEFGLG